MVFFTNLSADRALASKTTLSSSEKDLIKKYGLGGDIVQRWPDGNIYVYNQTRYKGLAEIVRGINRIIGGDTTFKLSNDKEKSRIIFETYSSIQYAYSFRYNVEKNEFTRWVVKVDKKHMGIDRLFREVFINIAGFDTRDYDDWWDVVNLDINIRKMLRSLYRVPPGFNLLTGKVED